MYSEDSGKVLLQEMTNLVCCVVDPGLSSDQGPSTYPGLYTDTGVSTDSGVSTDPRPDEPRSCGYKR